MPSTLYHVTFNSKQVTPDELKQFLINLGAKKAAQKELGELEQGAPYYHFIISGSRLVELWSFLLNKGRIDLDRAYSSRQIPPESVRIVMWLNRQTPEKEHFTHILQSVTNLKASREKVLNDNTKMKLIPEKPYEMRASFDVKEFSKFILERMDEGPLWVQEKLPQDGRDFYEYQFRLTKSETIKKPLQPSAVDLEIQLSPLSNVSAEQFEEWVYTQFPSLSWQVAEHIHDWHFQVRVELDQFIGLLSKLMPISLLNFSSNQKELAAKKILFLEIRVPKGDLVSKSYKQAKNLLDPVKQEKQIVLNEMKGPKRTYSKGGEVHAFGSAVMAPEGSVIIGDAYAQLWIENWGVRAHNIQSKTEISDYRFNSGEISMQYRFPLRKYTFGQSVVASAFYKNIATDGPAGDFEGVGVAYLDDIRPSVDYFLNKIPILRYPKTVEVNFEYLPISTTSHVSDIKAYVATIKMYMFLTKKFSLEGGIYNHYFHFSQRGGGKLDNRILFAELGLGYRF